MPTTDVQLHLDALHTLLFGEGNPLRLLYVRYADLKEQDVNANVMPAGMFNALVANVRKNGSLESLPLCATRATSPTVVEVVSGHHRVRAALQAGLEHGVVLCYEGLTDAEIRAKQLAHNSIHGASDPEIVREIFSHIEAAESQIEAYIDPELIGAVPDPIVFAPVEIDLMADVRTVVLVFLPTQFRAFDRAMETLKTEPDAVYLGATATFDGFKAAVNRVRAELDVISYPAALVEMARLAVERLDQVRSGESLANSLASVERSTEVIAVE